MWTGTFWRSIVSGSGGSRRALLFDCSTLKMRTLYYLGNVGNCLPVRIVLRTRRLESSSAPLQKPEISNFLMPKNVVAVGDIHMLLKICSKLCDF